TNVEKDKPADIAGLKRGDLIIKVGNQTIKNANDLKNLIGSLEPNKEIKITFERSNQIKDTTLKLANMDSGYIDPKDAYLTDGLSLQNLSDEIRYKFQIPKDIKGIIITNVKDDSNAANAGFEAGDIIVQVNEKIIYNVDDFTKEIKSSKAQNKKPIIWINRSGVLMGLVLK
ncbi:PDZ domain-containing protein, partial [Campylobacter fetus]